MFTPKNEQGVVALFSQLAMQAGWTLVDIGCSYPDAVFEKDGEEWTVEFEFCSSNFIDHRHDHRECDVIICWKNDYPTCPMPVIELAQDDWHIHPIEKCNPLLKEIEYWKRRCSRAEHQLKTEIDRYTKKSEYTVIQTTTELIVENEDDKKERAIQLKNEGLTNIQIGQELNVHRNTVSAWLRQPVHTNGYHKAQEA